MEISANEHLETSDTTTEGELTMEINANEHLKTPDATTEGEQLMEIAANDHSEPPNVPSTLTPDTSTEEQLMEMTTADHSEPPAVPSTLPPDTTTEEVMEMDYKNETGEEEGRKVLEVGALTGKFWLEWEKLKSLLSCHLKQVLSAYPEVKMSEEEQKSRLGETYEELVNRLDQALCSFIEGPPYTLQRLCEIFLGTRDIYPKLRKLAFALEKNLFVTSTLTISTGPYPPQLIKKFEEILKIEESQPHSDSIQNGDENVTNDKDEVMVEAEETDGESKINDDIKVLEISEVKSETVTPDSMPASDVMPVDS